MATTKNISIDLLEENIGQLEGLPSNPRWIRDSRFEALKKSIQDAPEMLQLRELLVYPLNGEKYIIIGGNMRFRACKELGFKELPCKVIPKHVPVAKLREYVIKDNEAFGQNEWTKLTNDWAAEELVGWGVELDAYVSPEGGARWDNMQEESTTEGKVVLTKEQLEELINKASEGSIVDYSEDTKYDLTKLFRYRGEHLQKLLDEGVKNQEIKPEIAELCRIRLAMCSIINFDEVIKYYRSDDCSACEKELLKRLYLVFITPREAVEAGMLKIVAETGKIFEEEILGEKENTEDDMEE